MIRRFETCDGDATYDVYCDAILNGTLPHYTKAQAKAWLEKDTGFEPFRWTERLTAGVTWVADENGVLTGFITLTENDHIDLFFVRPSARGRGTASALYDVVHAHASQQGITQLTTDASLLARSFFAKRGWLVDAEEVVERSGEALRRFSMSLKLNQDSQRS